MTTSHSAEEYLNENRRLAALLPGSRVETVVRMLESPTDEEARLEWGPALLTTTDGLLLLLDCEESKSNILLLDAKAGGQLSRSWYGGFSLRMPIAEEVAGHPLRPLLSSPIATVERISREPTPSPGLPDSFVMCGLRLTTVDEFQVCVGTHLSDPMYTQVAFLLPGEVDQELTYTAF